MKSTFEKLPKSQAKVIVTIPYVRVQEHVDMVISRLGSNVEVRGFRKGHAPKPLVIDRIGLGRVSQEALDGIMQEGYLGAIQEHKFNPISQPAVALKKFNLKPDGSITEDLEYELTIDLMPEVKLGDYTKIKLKDKDKKIIDRKIEVKDEEVDKVIDHLRRQKSTMTDVDRPVKKDDWVEISFTGTINKVVQEKLASKNHPLVIGSGAMVPGFEEAIIGMRVDNPKTIKITFPKDYYAQEFASKAAEFTIIVHKVKTINLPELTETFAKEYGQESVNSLKKAINEQLTQEKEEHKKQEIDSLVLEEAKKLLNVELPEGLVRDEIHRIIDRMRESVKKQGIEFDRYLESMKKTHDDLHKDYEQQARTNIEVGFLLGEVIKREKLKPEDKQSPQKALEKLVEYALKN